MSEERGWLDDAGVDVGGERGDTVDVVRGMCGAAVTIEGRMRWDEG